MTEDFSLGQFGGLVDKACLLMQPGKHWVAFSLAILLCHCSRPPGQGYVCASDEALRGGKVWIV